MNTTSKLCVEESWDLGRKAWQPSEPGWRRWPLLLSTRYTVPGTLYLVQSGIIDVSDMRDQSCSTRSSESDGRFDVTDCFDLRFVLIALIGLDCPDCPDWFGLP